MSVDKLIINIKPPKGEDNYRTFSIRIKEEIVEKLEYICKCTGYSRNGLISILLEYAIQYYSEGEVK